MIDRNKFELDLYFVNIVSIRCKMFILSSSVPQPCMAKPCMHGRCIDATNDPRYSQLSGGYLCLCEKGYTGKNCRSK